MCFPCFLSGECSLTRERRGGKEEELRALKKEISIRVKGQWLIETPK